MQYTNKGHALEHVSGLIFCCMGQTASHEAKTPEKEARLVKTHYFLSQLAIFAPCTRAQITHTLRGWLGVYDDEELLAQVEGVVKQALEALPDATPATPPGSPVAPRDQN
jgi:hypothetical protein